MAPAPPRQLAQICWPRPHRPHPPSYISHQDTSTWVFLTRIRAYGIFRPHPTCHIRHQDTWVSFTWINHNHLDTLVIPRHGYLSHGYRQCTGHGHLDTLVIRRRGVIHMLQACTGRIQRATFVIFS